MEQSEASQLKTHNNNINKLKTILINKMPSKEVERIIERAIGEDIETIRNTPIDEYRKRFETRTGKPIRLSPIGQRLVSHEECEKAYRSAIKTPWHEYVRKAYQRFFGH